MKTIGLLGGMSWESTALYYKLLNEEINAILGDLHSAHIVLESINFQPVQEYMKNGQWNAISELLCETAKKIEQGGADFLLICTNTMHKLAPEIQQAIPIPLLHLAEETAKSISAQNIQKVGLLGTRFTMEEDFYKDKLYQHGLEVIIPSPYDMDIVHEIIFNELCLGKISLESKKKFLHIIDKFEEAGGQGIIAGCTEICMLINQSDTGLPLFDTTAIHAKNAVAYSLGLPRTSHENHN